MIWNREKDMKYKRWRELMQLLSHDKLGCSICSVLDDYDTLQVFKLYADFEKKPYWKQVEVRIRLSELSGMSLQHQRQKILRLFEQEDKF